jgi:hypothetical protein
VLEVGEGVEDMHGKRPTGEKTERMKVQEKERQGKDKNWKKEQEEKIVKRMAEQMRRSDRGERSKRSSGRK